MSDLRQIQRFEAFDLIQNNLRLVLFGRLHQKPEIGISHVRRAPSGIRDIRLGHHQRQHKTLRCPRHGYIGLPDHFLLLLLIDQTVLIRLTFDVAVRQSQMGFTLLHSAENFIRLGFDAVKSPHNVYDREFKALALMNGQNGNGFSIAFSPQHSAVIIGFMTALALKPRNQTGKIF